MALSTIPIQPANPLHYLACCGIFEIASRFDPLVTGHWHCEAPVAFHLNTELDESTLANILSNTCSQLSRWKPNNMKGHEEVWRYDCEFTHAGKTVILSLDWWHETLESDGKIGEKSAWKMYAGQQTVEKITLDMVNASSALAKALPTPLTLVSLLNANEGMTGRFGFDPRSSRSALDVGYSPNDLGLPVATYPFAELLATIGLQTFFPGRCGTPGRLVSTRGWRREPEAFQYRLWSQPLPITLARAGASQSFISPATELESPRATRKNYSNLTSSRTR